MVASSPIWIVLQNPSRKYERELSHLRLSAEEVVYECLCVLDNVKEDPEGATQQMRGFWDDLFCNLRDLDLGDADEKELELATSVITYSVMLLLGMYDGNRYMHIISLLMKQICSNSEDVYNRLETDFGANVMRVGEEKLKACVTDYMDGDEWLSDDIGDRLKELPVMAVSTSLRPDNETPDPKVDQLTNRQLIILFENLLNVALQSEYTNISALAELISKVSGRSSGSVRQKIMAGNNYDDVSIKQDVRKLIALVEPISKEKAEILRRNIE